MTTINIMETGVRASLREASMRQNHPVRESLGTPFTRMARQLFSVEKKVDVSEGSPVQCLDKGKAKRPPPHPHERCDRNDRQGGSGPFDFGRFGGGSWTGFGHRVTSWSNRRTPR